MEVPFSSVENDSNFRQARCLDLASGIRVGTQSRGLGESHHYSPSKGVNNLQIDPGDAAYGRQQSRRV